VRDESAVKIQAAWRGFDVRLRLKRALELVNACEEDDEFAEVDLEGVAMIRQTLNG
jgi:hypothetical protein